MTYEDFLDEVKRKAHEELGYEPDMIEFFPEGYTSGDPKEIEWIIDSNARYAEHEATSLLTDILLLSRKDKKTGVTMTQRIDIRSVYQDEEENGLEEAFRVIRETSESLDAAPLSSEAIAQRSNATYEDMKDRLILRPLNYGLHIQDLGGCVYQKISDFVLVLYHLVQNVNGIIMTSRIKREELKRWGMEGRKDEVMRAALENTARLFPPCVYDQRTQDEANFLEGEFAREDITDTAFNSNSIALSTFSTANGAVALFYPGVIEKMMRILGGPFEAVFMNVNDVMIFDVGDPHADSYAALAKRSDHMGEMLSGKKYLCDERGVRPA